MLNELYNLHEFDIDIFSYSSSINLGTGYGAFTNDMAICEGKVGWIYGFGGGDKCNNCVLRDIKGEIIRTSNLSPKTPSVRLTSLKLICHNNNWQYQVLCS